MNAISTLPKLLTTEEAARFLGVSVGHLQNDRSTGATIPYVKIGRIVRYREDALLALIEAKTQPALR